jgi:hypothetical protein
MGCARASDAKTAKLSETRKDPNSGDETSLTKRQYCLVILAAKRLSGLLEARHVRN